MSVKSGRYARVVIDGNTIAELGSFTLSGFSRDVLEHTSFGSTVKKYVSGYVDGGEITFSGYYDPTDTTGQDILCAAAVSGRILAPGDLKVYIDSTYYFTVGAAGTMFVTKAKGINMDRAGLGTTDFTIKVTGASLELIPNPTLHVSASSSVSPSKSPSKSPSASPSKSPSASPSVSPSQSPS